MIDGRWDFRAMRPEVNPVREPDPPDVNSPVNYSKHVHRSVN